MWAQLIQMRLKPGKDTAEMAKQIRDAEQPGSGLVRTLMMRDQRDPSRVYTLVVFESEEKARAREQDPRRSERSPTECRCRPRSPATAIFERKRSLVRVMFRTCRWADTHSPTPVY